MSHTLKVHAATRGGVACGLADWVVREIEPDAVTCTRCLNVLAGRFEFQPRMAPPMPKSEPRFPRYPSVDYCQTCGLSRSHWSGCGAA